MAKSKWPDHNQYPSEGMAFATVLHVRLSLALLNHYKDVKFDHIRVACVDDQAVVFVAKGEQSAALYDKTEGFPSDKLMATLTLLGSS